MQQPRGAKVFALCVVATVFCTGLDLWSKSWAVDTLSRPQSFEVPPACTPNDQGHQYPQRGRADAVVLVSNYLELRYAENCGAAFGLLDEAPRWVRAGVFMSAGMLAVIALFVMLMRGNGGPLFAWSVPLVVSGALGNMIDRVRLGYVVDFIHFHIHEAFEWPTFNVADSTITVGVALLLLDGLRRGEAKPAPSAPATQTEAGPGTHA
jgi:signal peptidase II